MVWGSNYFSLLLLMTALISAAMAVYAWHRRAIPGGIAFFVLMAAVAEWSFGYTMELGSASMAAKFAWVRMQYFGIVTIPAAWLVFSLQYTGLRKLPNRRTSILLCIMPILTLLLVWTNPSHDLIWNSIELDSSGIVPVLRLQYGPAFWIHTVYSYLLVSAGMLGLFIFLLRAQRLFRRQVRLVILAFLIAWIVNIAYIFKLTPIPNLDLTPIAFTVTIVLAALGFLRTQFLDLVPLARGAILESMRDAVIVLDAWNRIADYNPVAEAITQRKLSPWIGHPARQVFWDFPEWVNRFEETINTQEMVIGGEAEDPRFFQLQISLLYDRLGRFTGRLVILQDITLQEQAKRELQKSNAELEIRVRDRTLALQERIEMERLVTNISTSFINRNTEEIEDEINRTLKIIGEFARVDRSYIFRLSTDGTSLCNTHEWNAPGAKSYKEQLCEISCEALSWWMERLNSGETIYLPREATLPQQAREEKEILRSKEVHSLIAVPIIYGNALIGFLGFDSDRKEKVWSQEDQTLLGLVGEIFAHAFARKETEEALRASEAELRGVFRAMKDQVLICDRSGRILKIAPNHPGFQPLQADEPSGKTLFEVFPARSARLILNQIQEALDKKTTLQVDYPVEIKGEQTWFSGAISPVQEDRIVLVSRDITERKASEERLIYKALHDVLTGLPNRRMFTERLERAYERVKRYPQRKAAVLYLDLDGFKAINDSQGHPAGDLFLTAIAHRLKSSMRASDTVARLGGDEFGILLEDIQGLEEAFQICRRIQEEVASPVAIENQTFSVTASIGIALVSKVHQRPEDVLREADTAMFQAKAKGKADYEVYSAEGKPPDQDEVQLRADLLQAVEHGEFQLFYQPVIELKSGETASLEALIRWSPS
jgi:diguanylate cyclase (GGDEF)-like protein/PAS domain S-box-containing protein